MKSSQHIPPLSTKDSLLIEAQRLLQKVGFDSFSFQDLADRVGIRKASVHSHFKDKEELGVKLAEKYLADFKSWVEYMSGRGPLEQIQSFARMMKRVYLAKDSVCANGAFLANWNGLTPRVQKKVLALQKTQIEWIQRCLDGAHADKTLKFEGPTLMRAQHLFVSMIGALQAARAWENTDIFDSMVKTTLKDLGMKK